MKTTCRLICSYYNATPNPPFLFPHLFTRDTKGVLLRLRGEGCAGWLNIRPIDESTTASQVTRRSRAIE